MIIFKVKVRRMDNPIVRREVLCDLIDHDRTGDIRLYEYTGEDKLDTSQVRLVWKFESHVEFIEEVEWV